MGEPRENQMLEGGYGDQNRRTKAAPTARWPLQGPNQNKRTKGEPTARGRLPGAKTGKPMDNREPTARGRLQGPKLENQWRTTCQRAITGTNMGEPRGVKMPEGGYRDHYGRTIFSSRMICFWLKHADFLWE